MDIYRQKNETGLYTNINLKFIKNLYIRPETVKFQKENIEEKLHDIGLGSDFLTMTPKAHIQNQKWGYIRSKSFSQQRKQ